MDIVYFIILISSLIFVHELGHFLVAKAFGVKVLTFSLGFGPKVLCISGRETEYCISLLPLGGYVKMLEETKSDLVMPEDRSRTFESLPVYKRIMVALAGPLMNLLFPVLLYFSVFVTEGPFSPPTVGVVLPEHPASGVLFPGDRILSVQGQEVGTFDEVRRIVERSPGETLNFLIFRNNQQVHVDVVVQERRRKLELDMVHRYGAIGIQPHAPAAVIGISSPDSPAYRAGLRTFDVITFVAGRRIDRFSDLRTELDHNRGTTIPVTYMRPQSVAGVLGGLADMAVYETGVVSLTPNVRGETLVDLAGIELADRYAASVPKGSYLYQAGLRPGDRIVSLDGQRIPAWSTFVDRLASTPDEMHRLEFISGRDGQTRSGSFRIRREEFSDQSGQRYFRYVLPCGSWANLAEAGESVCDADSARQWLPLSLEEQIEHPNPMRYAFFKAVDRTISATRFISLTFIRLAQGRVSLQEIGGPIAIYEIAGREGRKGTEYFIWVMAMISINLGLLNLLPIPVLDGGHLLFFALEGIMRRPLPMRVREIAHILGMAVLFLLMTIAFKNDIAQRLDRSGGDVGGP